MWIPLPTGLNTNRIFLTRTKSGVPDSRFKINKSLSPHPCWAIIGDLMWITTLFLWITVAVSYLPVTESANGESSNQPCIFKGRLTTDKDWYGYLSNITIMGTGRIQYEFSYPADRCCQNILFYTENQVNILNARMNCWQKEALLRPEDDQILRLTPRFPWSGCHINYPNSVPMYTCHGGRSFTGAGAGDVPTTYFMAVSNCATGGLDLQYYIELVGHIGECNNGNNYQLTTENSAVVDTPKVAPLKPGDSNKIQTQDSHTCVIEGKLNTTGKWHGFLANITFAKGGGFRFKFTYLMRNVYKYKQYVILYNDGDIKKLSKSIGCWQKQFGIIPAEKEPDQILDLSVFSSWNGCVSKNATGKKGLTNLTCQGERRFDTPRKVFIAVNILNARMNCWQKEALLRPEDDQILRLTPRFPWSCCHINYPNSVPMYTCHGGRSFTGAGAGDVPTTYFMAVSNCATGGLNLQYYIELVGHIGECNNGNNYRVTTENSAVVDTPKVAPLKPGDSNKIQTQDSHTCVIEGKLNTTGKWHGFLANITFAKGGGFRFKFTYLMQNVYKYKEYVILYNDGDIKKLSKSIGCWQKQFGIIPAEKEPDQILDLSVFSSWNRCVSKNATGKKGLTNLTCQGERRFDTPRKVFIAVSNCKAVHGLRLGYRFEVFGYEGNVCSRAETLSSNVLLLFILTSLTVMWFSCIQNSNVIGGNVSFDENDNTSHICANPPAWQHHAVVRKTCSNDHYQHKQFQYQHGYDQCQHEQYHHKHHLHDQQLITVQKHHPNLQQKQCDSTIISASTPSSTTPNSHTLYTDISSSSTGEPCSQLQQSYKILCNNNVKKHNILKHTDHLFSGSR